MKAKLTVTVNDQTTSFALPEEGVRIGRDAGPISIWEMLNNAEVRERLRGFDESLRCKTRFLSGFQAEF